MTHIQRFASRLRDCIAELKVIHADIIDCTALQSRNSIMYTLLSL